MSLLAHHPRPLVPPRVAALVAEQLRGRILSGDLPDGSLLPKEDDLRAGFGVGKPAMREAMRILESEGLVTVLRGNRGGAVVHLPTVENIAYALGVSLTSMRVRAREVGRALAEVEPLCAALCATRADRARTVVPALSALLLQAEQALSNSAASTALFRRFHEEMVAGCGNEPLILMTGALERLWSAHVASARGNGRRPRPSGDLLQSAAEHKEIMRLIADGDAEGARRAVAAHLTRVQSLPTAANRAVLIDLTLLQHANP